jgi:hypothetical protein
VGRDCGGSRQGASSPVELAMAGVLAWCESTGWGIIESVLITVITVQCGEKTARTVRWIRGGMLDLSALTLLGKSTVKNTL